MPTADTIDVVLTSTDIDVELTSSPPFDVTLTQSDIVISAVTMANQGPQGDAATIAVGTTSTLTPGNNATVVNVGDMHAAVFNFGIPAGAAGPAGSQGVTGNPGAAATI